MNSLEPNHLELAVILNNISAIEYSRGKYKEVLGLLNNICKVQKAKLSKFKKNTNSLIAITLTSAEDVCERLNGTIKAIVSHNDATRIHAQYFQNA